MIYGLFARAVFRYPQKFEVDFCFFGRVVEDLLVNPRKRIYYRFFEGLKKVGGSPEGVVSFIELVGVYMINRISFSLLSILLFSSNNVNAAFPDDFEGVILEATSDEAGIRNFAVTATLDFSSSGGFLVLDSDKASVWPERSVFGTAINANAWVFAKFDDQWHGHTFDYMRPGQIAKSTGALKPISL